MIEMAYAAMARASGINVPETHLFEGRDGRRHFGIQRFDRDPLDPARRIHMHTFAGLLNLDFRVPAQDYTDLLNVTRALTRNHQDVVAAFRQMVFNIFAHNRDDHTKNFAFLMSPDGEWRLSPAYDLVFSPGPGGEHTLTVDGAGKAPGIEDIERVAEKASLQRREVDEVLDSVRAAVSDWREVAAMCGVSRTGVRDVEAAFSI
jgi:serine/threonine-protein kinase HipA